MPTIETVVSPPTPGAGRSFSVSWPNFVFAAASTQPNPDALYRQAGLGATFFVKNDVAGTVPPAPQGLTEYKGVQAYQVSATVNTLRIFYPDDANNAAGRIYPTIQRPLTTDYGALDGFACWRISALLAFDNPAGVVASDLGLCLCVGNGNSPRLGDPGISLGVTGPQTVAVTTCQGGGAGVVENAVVNPPDVTQWNTYEFRIIGATKAAEGVIRALVNGRNVGNFPWGPGTQLPVGALALTFGTVLGFRWVVANRGGAAFTTNMYIAAGGVQLSAAPTEGDLL